MSELSNTLLDALLHMRDEKQELALDWVRLKREHEALKAEMNKPVPASQWTRAMYLLSDARDTLDAISKEEGHGRMSMAVRIDDFLINGSGKP